MTTDSDSDSGWRTWPVLVDFGSTEPDRNGFDLQLAIVQMPRGDTMVRFCLRRHGEPLRRLDVRALHASGLRPLLARLPTVAGCCAGSGWNREEAERLIASVPADELVWETEAHNDGTSQPSADYIDGCNDAIDKYARPLADALRSALAEIALLTTPTPIAHPKEAPCSSST